MFRRSAHSTTFQNVNINKSKKGADEKKSTKILYYSESLNRHYICVFKCWKCSGSFLQKQKKCSTFVLVFKTSSILIVISFLFCETLFKVITEP